MFYKDTVSAFFYMMIMAGLYAQLPLLAAPWIKWLVDALCDALILPSVQLAGRSIDFKIIDDKFAEDDGKYQESISKVKAVTNPKELSDEERKKLIDEHHANLNRLLKLQMQLQDKS